MPALAAGPRALPGEFRSASEQEEEEEEEGGGKGRPAVCLLLIGGGQQQITKHDGVFFHRNPSAVTSPALLQQGQRAKRETARYNIDERGSPKEGTRKGGGAEKEGKKEALERGRSGKRERGMEAADGLKAGGASS